MARRLTLDYLKTESGAGLLLAGAALMALAMANSPLAHRYFAFIAWPLPIRLGDFAETRTVAAWVKDGLMTIFFLVLGMEIKFEVLRGELSSTRRLALPLLAALGGVVGPALVYLAINLGAGGAAWGWPTATATDVALALTVLAIAAPRTPAALRLFLLTVAVVDNLLAVGLMGVLLTEQLHLVALASAGATLAGLMAMSRWRRAPFLFYAAGFVLVWAFTLESGVSPAVAGVACALTVPIGARRAGQDSVIKYFMDSIHPYVAFGVAPLFVFTAAGFSFHEFAASDLAAPPAAGIALGLMLGKPLGVFGLALLAATTKIGRRPTGVTWVELMGAALLCGVGLTPSLFIGAAAFDDSGVLAEPPLRAAVLAASLVSALAGGVLLAWAQARRTERGEDAREG